MLSMYFSDARTIEFISILVAILAISLTFWTMKETRRHNRVSVMPHIVSPTNSDEIDCECGFYIKNVGMGSALDIKYTILLDGLPVSNRKFNSEHRNLVKHDENDFITSSKGEEALSPNSETYIYRIEIVSKNAENFLRVERFMKRMSVEVIYSSVLGDELRVVCSHE